MFDVLFTNICVYNDKKERENVVSDVYFCYTFVSDLFFLVLLSRRHISGTNRNDAIAFLRLFSENVPKNPHLQTIKSGEDDVHKGFGSALPCEMCVCHYQQTY